MTLINSITYLTLGHNFNRPVNHLPKNVTHLKFGYKFNQSIDNLPKNITHLTFGHDFNQPLDNLPKNITHLTFELGSTFNHSLEYIDKRIKIQYEKINYHYYF
jgi:hypothetical protein